ncbi:MAG: hypothetical protein Ct9H300mP17_06310 [Candidatus Nitrosopelagicus sp.]|nr:MAG: hypothetical protein Ct9H300mP17_06310 [Candidatus Nitrosopelagicus sp.]
MMGHRGVRVAITFSRDIKKCKLPRYLKPQQSLQRKRLSKTTDYDSTSGKSLAELNYIKSIYDDEKKRDGTKIQEKIKK